MIEWYVKGLSYGNCNCDHACPCQFEGLPTKGYCEAFEVVKVQEGEFGDVDLAGAQFAMVYAWPGPVFEGGGHTQMIIDERCSDAQREAIGQLATGKETIEASTHWWVYANMCDTHHELLVKRIDLDIDMSAFTAKCHIDGVLESTGEPIRSPVDGSPHRVRIQVPHGIEFETAEIINASIRTQGPVKLDFKDSYGQLNNLHQTCRGPAHNMQPA
jgi:hypothetical protein